MVRELCWLQHMYHGLPEGWGWGFTQRIYLALGTLEGPDTLEKGTLEEPWILEEPNRLKEYAWSHSQSQKMLSSDTLIIQV